MSTALLLASSPLVLVGCASGASGTSESGTAVPSASIASDPLGGVTGELVITRQRDLLDRGLINVMTTNDSAISLQLDDIHLLADTFDTPPAPDRTISVRAGRQVAIQVPYGVVVDCASEPPVAATLAFSYAGDDGTSRQVGHIDLDGTDILDTIRAEQCAQRQLDEVVLIGFGRTEIADGKVATELLIEPIGQGADLEVSAVSGTILVSVHAADSWSGTRVGEDSTTIPLTFTVNRCDPHALGEVTKRYGLDLMVSINGGDPVSVAVDVDELVPDLEAIVELCRARSSDG